MKTILYPSKQEKIALCQRPVLQLDKLYNTVETVFAAITQKGDQALKEYSLKFDQVDLNEFRVSESEFLNADKLISQELKDAIEIAFQNIKTFHEAQKPITRKIETSPGVICWRENRAIEKVGLYIPGGTAPLFSTVLMLGIPAQLAGCGEIVLCSPPDKKGNIHPAILYAARKVGVHKVFKLGGIQAIAAMSIGTTIVPKANKIFGPGNQYVMAAKQIAFQYGTAIDLPAGPSEVLVIADDSCRPDFVAADLLSQAEHGPDSQVILLTTSEKVAKSVNLELELQLESLNRKNIAKQALENSKIIILNTLEECMDLSNFYAPEHLILAVENPDEMGGKVENAGSVFLGNHSCESAGDYASGTNHTLPTNGHAKAYSGVSLDSFVKKITFQQVHPEGIKNIGKTVAIMAAEEGLEAHQKAMTIRIENL